MHRRYLYLLAPLALGVLWLPAEDAAIPAPERFIWKDPGPVESLDLARGPATRVPTPPFTFIREDTTGTSPKIEVRDSNSAVWRVKFGNEASPDVFASRIAWACGYSNEVSWFLRFGHVEAAKPTGRAAPHLKNGHFLNARFALSNDSTRSLPSETWSWLENPFAGSRELKGLKVLMMTLSNWDNKDARDLSRGSNTVVLETANEGRRRWWYGVTDWGASMGKWGGVASREKWDCRGYTEQTPDLVKDVLPNSIVKWGFSGQHTDSFATDIAISDVRWLMGYLGRISDSQIRGALEASGAGATETECFTRALRQRINRLAEVSATEAPRLHTEAL